MTWGQEIFRALLLAFGVTEILTNLSYLIKENGLALARKQHGELPPKISAKKIKLKVICMLFSGSIFFISALLSYILHKYISVLFLIPSIIFCLYGITEALYYRYWKTFGFATVTIIMLLCAKFL